MTTKTVGRKDDTGKPRWSLLPWISVAAVVVVLEYGARKYAPNNWQHVVGPQERYFDAAMRHLYAWRCGEHADQESGCSHLAHAATCLLFMIWFEEKKP
jgi:hypothetical protein